MTTFYNVFHEHPMHWMIAVYFFLSGISGGAFLVSIACRFWAGEGLDRIRRIGAFLAPPALALGLLFLLLDLGNPFRFWRMFFHFNPTSIASWGVWLMNIFLLINLVHAYFSWRQDEEKGRIFALIGTPFALAIALYSGFILTQMKAHVLWHSALIPVLFSVSAVISAMALIVLIAVLSRVEKEAIRKMGKFLVWLISFDLLLVFVEMIILFNGHREAIELAKLLLVGAYAPLFLGLYIIIGLIVPLLVLSRKELSPGAGAIASILILIGIFVMRYVIVMGGEYFPLS